MSYREFVTFRLGKDLFGLEARLVQEVNRTLDITPVQQAPEYVRGLVNLRGTVVTVLDLGVLLDLGRREITTDSANVILNTERLRAAADQASKGGSPGSGDPVGLLVDALGDVVSSQENEVDRSPATLQEAKGRFVDGIVKLEEELVTILDPAAVVRGGSGES